MPLAAKLNIALVRACLALHDSGLSGRKIAEQLQVSKTQVAVYLKKFLHRRGFVASYGATSLSVNEKAKMKRRKIQDFCEELKRKTPCKDCGKHDEAFLMDFDHRETNKVRSPHAAGTWKTLQAELEKCDIVCVRCHRIRTHERRINGKTKT